MRSFNEDDICATFEYQNLKLVMFWDGCTQGSKPRLSFILSHNNEELYKGDDLCLGAGTAPDSKQAVIDCLGFMTVKPGDTDEDFFKDHSSKFLELLEEDPDMIIENIRLYLYDIETDDEELKEQALKFFEEHTTF